MALTGTRTYVGFGFGAIQSGLFLLEAFRSRAFRRLVVAEVMPEVVEAVRDAGGAFSINVAHADGIERVQVGPVEIENPTQDADRARIIDAIAEAQEIGTGVPSVGFYASDSPGSLHRLLAAGLRQKAAAGGPRAVVYTAENNNYAAELLEAHVLREIPEAEHTAVHSVVRFLNTVIGKMSGVVTDPGEVALQQIALLTSQAQRAFLVESFNRILISPIRFDAPFERGIAVFDEKPDLMPFEEAKLFGHNAVHALAAYLGMMRGQEFIAEVMADPGILAFLRGAWAEEIGAALLRKYGRIDPLFTPEGFSAYSEDLLKRMGNPYLRDTVERIGRDPVRKLSWGDRLIGTMRLALRYGIEPKRCALGAAAALQALQPDTPLESLPLGETLLPLWQEGSAFEQAQILALIEGGRAALLGWIAAGSPPLEEWTAGHFR
ncbi:MAG: hypothetical protein L6Q98_17595 [Anaerolineae bacterium]|nr:hypothetical protein [Anaerolineae bacterium]NUQ04704.1 hypothetical protein [Anaerolineae bacterium]